MSLSYGFYMKTKLGCFWLDLQISFQLFSLISTLFDIGDSIKYFKILQF